ncbi:Monoglyceride lipase [Entamoeba marina]
MTHQYNEKTYSIGNYTIFSREWIQFNPKSNIIFLHGYGDYSGRYDHVGDFFWKKGYNVFMLDLPGHGRSSHLKDDPFTYIDSMETYIDVINNYIDTIKQTHGRLYSRKLPLYFFGHSMGGLITNILASRRKDIDAYVASAPAFIIDNPLITYFYYIILILVFLFPKIYVPTGPASDIITNKEVAIDYENDKYTLSRKASIKTSSEMVKYGSVEVNRDLYCPMYIMHGSGDTLIKVEGSRIKHTHLKHEKSKYVEYPGANHVLLEEDNKMDMLNDIEAWLTQFN